MSDRLFGSAVLDFIIEHATEDTVVAIDAPLIIRNHTRQRPCERLIGKRFGKYKASAHSSNLTLYPEAGSVRLASELKKRGFAHDVSPQSDRRRPGRWFFEVYPHPAQVVLFGLSERIPYKKGNVGQRRRGLQSLRGHIWQTLGGATPPLLSNLTLERLLSVDVESLRGRTLKQYEDRLDALFCAYLALYYWTWGAERNEMMGDMKTGYIVNPTA